MQARLSLPYRSNLVLWLLALLGAGVIGIFSLSLLKNEGGNASQSVILPADKPLVAYFQFGPDADTLWLADPDQASKRQKLIVLPHAADFGVVPSLAPDGRRFVYTALPPGVRSPSADSPAELWLAALAAEENRRLLARDVDLLVRPVWSPDGGSVVFRRSGEASRLFSFDLVSGTERELVAESGGSLFPVAFSPDAGGLYYVRLQSDGSYFVALNASDGSQGELGRLSAGLTRDWTLSPDGTRLAYLQMNLEGSLVSSNAYIFDLKTGVAEPVDGLDGDVFSPVWLADGGIAVGQVSNHGNGIVQRSEEGSRSIQPPARGFDVPLAFSSAAGRFAVRSFNGSSATRPGSATLAVVGLDGNRTTIATGEVTFLGWIE